MLPSSLGITNFSFFGSINFELAWTIHRPTSVRFLKVSLSLMFFIDFIAERLLKDAPVPDTLRLWMMGPNDYILRSNTPTTLLGIQKYS